MRLRFDFCASLLNWYDTVIYTDVDELLVADPARFDSLVAYTSSLAEDAAVTAAGVDVVHVPDQEARLDWNQPISTQRSWLRFSSAMCKPVAIRQRVAWAPGFHCIDDAPRFGELFLFHLRYADLQAGLDRLQRTRRQPWITPEAGSHQRMPDASWETMLRQMAGLPRRQGVELSLIQDPLARWIALVRDSAETRRDELYRIDLHLSGDELWQLPDRFRGRF